MPEQKVVLVTGVAGYIGKRVAARLAALPELHVIGVDSRRPKEQIYRLDFVQADVRNGLLADLFGEEQVAVIYHLAFTDSDRPNENAFDLNVMGTIRVMGAAAAAGVQRVIVPSSTLVYGARPENSAFLSENQPLRGSERQGTVRDLTEIESFCNGYRRRYPQVELVILRFANMLGLGIQSPMTRFLRESAAPILLGFDPMMQVIHEEDVVEALVHALDGPAGVYNIAAEDVLPLTQLMALAGKTPIPLLHWGVYWGSGLLRAAGIGAARYLPFDPDYLRYSCVGDLTRMREVLGFAPRLTAVEALREFAGRARIERYLPEQAALVEDEQRLAAIIEERREARARGDGREAGLAAAAGDGATETGLAYDDDESLRQDYEVDANE